MLIRRSLTGTPWPSAPSAELPQDNWPQRTPSEARKEEPGRLGWQTSWSVMRIAPLARLSRGDGCSGRRFPARRLDSMMSLG